MPQFTPQQILQRQLTFYPLFAAGAVTVLWIIVALNVWGGWDPLSLAKLSDESGWIGYAALAAVITIGAPIVMMIYLARTRALLSRGQTTRGRVASVSGASSGGRRAVTFSYVVGGREFKRVEQVSDDELDTYTDSTTVPVIYDPHNPANAQAFSGWPDQALDVEEDSLHGVKAFGERILWAVLGFGQLVGLLVLGKWLFPEQFSWIGLPLAIAIMPILCAEAILFDRLLGRDDLGSRASHRWLTIMLIVSGVIVLVWLPWAYSSANDEIAAQQQREIDSAAERQRNADAQRTGQEAMKKLEELRRQREQQKSNPKQP